MKVHKRKPSKGFFGDFAICGASPDADHLSEDWSKVDCGRCKALRRAAHPMMREETDEAAIQMRIELYRRATGRI